jgi:hypothetical protein
VLGDNHIAIRNLWFQPLIELSSPASPLKHLLGFHRPVIPGHVQPAVKVADLVLMMHTIVDGKLVGSHGCNSLIDVCDGVRLCQALGKKLIELAIRAEEVVIRINEDPAVLLRDMAMSMKEPWGQANFF